MRQAGVREFRGGGEASYFHHRMGSRRNNSARDFDGGELFAQRDLDLDKYSAYGLGVGIIKALRAANS